MLDLRNQSSLRRIRDNRFIFVTIWLFTTSISFHIEQYPSSFASRVACGRCLPHKMMSISITLKRVTFCTLGKSLPDIQNLMPMATNSIKWSCYRPFPYWYNAYYLYSSASYPVSSFSFSFLFQVRKRCTRRVQRDYYHKTYRPHFNTSTAKTRIMGDKYRGAASMVYLELLIALNLQPWSMRT
jgi:hypothetical protein